MSALFGAFADDAAGLLCVHVETNGNAVVEMPFAPYGNAKPDAFLSGPMDGSQSGGLNQKGKKFLLMEEIIIREIKRGMVGLLGNSWMLKHKVIRHWMKILM